MSSKYYGQIDIKTDLPDVFVFEPNADKSDADELQTTNPMVESENDSIDKSGIEPDKSFMAINKKIESEEKGKRPKKADDSNNGEFIIQEPSKPETSFEKLNRLKVEVQALEKELQTNKNPNVDENITPEKLLNELKSLQVKLQDLAKQEKNFVKPKVSGNNTLPLQADLSKKLLSELHSYTSDTTTTTPASTSDKVTYELYYANDYNKSKSLVKTAELEKRVTDIENLVGRNGLPEEFPDLQTGVEQLQHKLKLFDSSKLDAIKNKMQTVGDEIKIFLSKKEKVPAGLKEGTEKKIEECYATILKWDPIAQQLPIIINRLQSLKVLHEESVIFNETLNQITTEQTQVSELLKSNENTFKELDKNFKANTQAILSNIEALDKRFVALAARIDKIQH